MLKQKRTVLAIIQKFLLGLGFGFFTSCLLLDILGQKDCIVPASVENEDKIASAWKNHDKVHSKIFVGIMSTEEFIPNRMRTALDTWIPAGNWTIRVYADVEEDLLDRHNSKRNKNKISIIGLPGVDDHAYPPQKKSFMLLRDMFDSNNNANDYDWYVRVDDDSYVSYNRLNALLSQLDPNEPIFIGKPGFGKDEDDYIEDGMTYYQGGLGMIFSRKLIQQARPHLQTCINNMLSPHEDIEIGRCIWRHTKARYTVAHDTYSLFFQSFNKQGKRVNVEKVPEDVIPRVITLHPNKEASLTYKLHQFMRIADIKDKFVGLFKLSQELDSANDVIRHEVAKIESRSLHERIIKRSVDQVEDNSERHPISPPEFNPQRGFLHSLSNVHRLSASSLSSIVDDDSWGYFTKSDVIFNHKDELFGYTQLGGKFRYEWKFLLNNIFKKIYNDGHAFQCLEFVTSSYKTLSEHISFSHGYFRMLADRGVQVVLLFKRLKPSLNPISACVLAADVGFSFVFMDDSQSILHVATEASKSPKLFGENHRITRSLQTTIKQAIANFTCLSKQSEQRLAKPNNVHDILLIPFNSVDPELIKQEIAMLQEKIPCFHSLKTVFVFKALTSNDFSKPVFKEITKSHPNVRFVDHPKWSTQLVKSGIDFIENTFKDISKSARILIAYPGVVIGYKFIEECHKWTKNPQEIWFPIINATFDINHKTCKKEAVISNIIDVDVSRQKIYDSVSWQSTFYGVGCGYLADLKRVLEKQPKAKVDDNSITDEVVRDLRIIRHKVTDNIAQVPNFNSYAISYLLKEERAMSKTKAYETLQFKLYCSKRR